MTVTGCLLLLVLFALPLGYGIWRWERGACPCAIELALLDVLCWGAALMIVIGQALFLAARRTDFL